MTADERMLVQRCLQRDASAIQTLVERYQGPVHGLCIRLLRDRHEAEDVAQEVFLRVFRSLGRWDPSRPLKPWILAIAVNRCRTWMSRRTRRPVIVDHLAETACAGPTGVGSSGAASDAVEAAELRAEIESALDDLRPEFRSVFVMFHEQGLPYETIAEALARPVGTIKTWLHRARLQLLTRLRGRGMVTDVEADRASPNETSGFGAGPLR